MNPAARLAEQGRYEEAIRAYIQLARSEPSRLADHYASIAGCLYRLKRTPWAQRLAEHARRISEQPQPAALLVLANILFDNKEFTEAADLYQQLLATDLSAQAALCLTAIQKVDHNSNNAKDYMKVLQAKEQHSFHDLLCLAKHALDRDNSVGALRFAEKALTIKPEHADAWEAAYQALMNLKQYVAAKETALKLINLSSRRSKWHEYLGLACYQLQDFTAMAAAYEQALALDPNNLVLYLNASNPFTTIPESPGRLLQLEQSIRVSSHVIAQKLNTGGSWKLSTNTLLPSAFFLSYADINLKPIYTAYYSSLASTLSQVLESAREALPQSTPTDCRASSAITTTSEERRHTGRNLIRIGFLSRYFYAHSNTQAFKGIIKYLDRSQFEVILIHRHDTQRDALQDQINATVDQVVYLTSELQTNYCDLKILDLDILFFTDLGMNPFDFLLPELRACPIQVTGWGLPHTTGLTSINYYLSSRILDSPSSQDEFSEELVLLDGLPCCFLREDLHYKIRPRDYFMLPSDRVLLGCLQTLHKIHPDFDEILEEIAELVPDALFVFATSDSDTQTQAFLNRLQRRAPLAHSRTLFLERSQTDDYLSMCDCMDLLLDTPYYGGGVTYYMSYYVGTPIVAYRGGRLRGATAEGLYTFTGVQNPPLAGSHEEYVQLVAALAADPERRLQLKREIVEKADILYDNQTFIRGMERFFTGLVGAKAP
ncbi:tetratricopeptide repeat protein [Vulcanococcus limneticus Candia 3F8]|uniref:O-linked N-acetylglucosamine transferase family protein n=1 Tax=Vulcanococcus limneticus TaxID=2170428 RepID=UPI000B97FFC5|nr:tetratricopeptide repeat protein [Vulcanococcus limneticus]MCP9793126.1 tetratricopeptide repeat protein [Vulcanococcus limneticus MW73D5]MCP9895064.1 tetratricopeptide repeat protein [Vulcanococcus limneticus Candia 3F8]MCP9898504.1 tetratricopeptide repeat protein [Vulcanococcus limneticus Candia 3B3]